VSKYWHIISLGVQNTLVYRVNFFFRALFNLIPWLSSIVLWQAIFADKASPIAGYTLAQMVSYYLLVTMVDMLTTITEDDWQIANDIKDGLISQFLVKPLDYLSYRFCLFVSGRLIYTLAASLPVAVFLAWHHHFILPPADLATVAFFLWSIALAAVLTFLLSFIVATLAFWVLEISTFAFILLVFERITSGHMFPLDILPPPFTQCLMLTPFPYQMFFPVSIYMGRVTGVELYQGLIIQAGWVAILYCAARLLWQRGVRTYAAVGG
jgi:ABC-2 type transport system permease protein